ncbi:MAG: extracellular solute-binding protein [Planctomycetota bacterium]|nr:extracellular solute-binding protein [Planctomycetota bacterium]
MRYVWISLFALVIACLAFGPTVFLREPPADEELQIISPHWDGIRCEFGRAFTAQYLKIAGKHLRVVWLDIGNTGEIRKYLDERFSQAKPGEGVGADILFGGGMDILPRMAARNYFEPYRLPDGTLKDLPPSVNGLDLRDSQYRYYAACLGGFGFVFNKLVLQRAHLPVPAKWEDLCRPAFQGWVSCGDPTLSGSMHAAFEVVLQGQGWERGWCTLARMASNARAFNEGGSSVPRDVSLGQAAVGPCIDFYASAPVRRQGATHLQLVIPKGQAVVTPDCIAVLRGPPNRRAAEAFLAFVLSEEGQRLWYQARGTEGGPVAYDLERLPVMPRIYDMGLPTNTVMNPFKSAADFRYDSKKAGGRWGLLNDLWRAVLIDAHEELWDARQAAVAAGRDDDLGQALATPPLTEDQVWQVAQKSMPADARNELRNRWTAWASNWYREVEAAARTNAPVPAFHPAPAE